MKTLWGGRFAKAMHPLLKNFSYSLAVDQELLDAEIRVDRAWVKMLERIGILKGSEASRLLRGLKSIEQQWCRSGSIRIPENLVNQVEDIHTLIQDSLKAKAGASANKLHTGRSRNDLVVTSTRLYLREKISQIAQSLVSVEEALASCAQKAGGEVMAGVTHMRKAQPVLLAHHLLAYVEMLDEDRERLLDARKRVDVLGLGAGALTGSGIAVDQKFLAKELGFSKVATNSLAAVSDRAFLAEFLSALSILWMHLSRLAADFILWNSEFFGFVELDDAFATGSSLMPQKKNPDVFELIRGRASIILGDLVSLLSLQKGLALGYHRDLQEDKPPVFDAARKTEIALKLLALTLKSVSFRSRALAASVADDNLFATDLLDYLVRKGVDFSKAHETVGKAVRYAMENDKPMRTLSIKEWKRFSQYFSSDVYDLFDPKHSVSAKQTVGSTHPARVRGEIVKWQRLLKRVTKPA